MKIWYVYKVEFKNGDYYIGYRGTKKQINDDFLVKYYTSSKIVKNRIGKDIICGSIILQTFNKEEAYNTEQKIIYDMFGDEHLLNRVCFYERKGFGLFSDAVLKDMSEKSKLRWLDENYRKNQLSYDKWSDERKKEHSKYLINRWKNDNVYRNNIIKSNTGRIKTQKELDILHLPKTEEHKNNISKALKNIPKTEEHKNNMKLAFVNRISPIRKIRPVTDHNGNIYENERILAKRYGIRPTFFRNLNVPIKYNRIYDKLGIEINEINKKKTKLELGFKYIE